MPAGQRRQARIAALQTLYESEYAANSPGLILDRTVKDKNLEEKSIEFARALVEGVIHNKAQLDEVIGRFAPNFPVNQMAAMDRNILRIALFEFLVGKLVPAKVAINEAVELAKNFGSDTSPRFINGVLGAVVSGLSK
jgi:N utilization substance protein B